MSSKILKYLKIWLTPCFFSCKIRPVDTDGGAREMKKSNDVIDTIGANIRRIRKQKSISIDELADRLGISSGYLGLMERGKRGISPVYLQKISEAFDVPINVFFTSGDHPEAKRIIHSDLQDQIRFMVQDMNENELKFVLRSMSDLKNLRSGN